MVPKELEKGSNSAELYLSDYDVVDSKAECTNCAHVKLVDNNKNCGMKGIAFTNFTGLQAICKTNISFVKIVICYFRGAGGDTHFFDIVVAAGKSRQSM